MDDVRNFGYIVGKDVIFTWADGARADREGWQTLYHVVGIAYVGNYDVWIVARPLAEAGVIAKNVKMFPLSAVLGIQVDDTPDAKTAEELDEGDRTG